MSKTRTNKQNAKGHETNTQQYCKDEGRQTRLRKQKNKIKQKNKTNYEKAVPLVMGLCVLNNGRKNTLKSLCVFDVLGQAVHHGMHVCIDAKTGTMNFLQLNAKKEEKPTKSN
jgi:hypothetical protein